MPPSDVDDVEGWGDTPSLSKIALGLVLYLFVILMVGVAYIMSRIIIDRDKLGTGVNNLISKNEI